MPAKRKTSVSADKKKIVSNRKQTNSEPHRPFYFAREYNEKKVVKAIKCSPPPHEYFGYIYAATSERPPNYYKNYFLPMYPQPSYNQHVHIVAPPVPQDRILTSSDTPGSLMPLSTIKVQWGLNKRCTVYNREDIYKYFSRFGQVEAVYSWTINSCLVVFTHLSEAKTVATNPHLGAPWGRLVTSWLNPLLNNQSVYQKYVEMLEGEQLLSSLESGDSELPLQ